MRLIRALRQKAGLSGFELAQLSSVNPSDVSAIEHGRRVPPRDSITLRRLADALGFDGEPGTLLDEVDHEQGA